MRRGSARYLLACTCALVWTASAGAAQPPAVSTEDTLIALERGWNDAVYARDVEFLDSILADEFVVTYDDGTRGDRDREIALVAGFNQRVISATQEDFVVRTYGVTAIVWFDLRVVGLRQGREAELRLAYTDVWVRRDGRWQCVSSHATRIDPR